MSFCTQIGFPGPVGWLLRPVRNGLAEIHIRLHPGIHHKRNLSHQILTGSGTWQIVAEHCNHVCAKGCVNKHRIVLAEIEPAGLVGSSRFGGNAVEQTTGDGLCLQQGFHASGVFQTAFLNIA